MLFERFERHWKLWIFIPFIFLTLAVIVIITNTLTYGSFMQRDVDLTGGKILTFEVSSEPNLEKLSSILPDASIHLTKGVATNLMIEIPYEKDEASVIEIVRANAAVVGEPTTRTIGPALGEIFYQQIQTALLMAFAAMAIIVFILFRSFAPSSIVVLSATIDILVTIMVINFIGVKLSLHVLAALLMLIGYSVDTDIVLTTELLKAKKKEISERVRAAMKTGLTMVSTIIAALGALYLFSGSFIIEEIALVLIIGLIIDVFSTWFTNAGLLRWWLEKKERKIQER